MCIDTCPDIGGTTTISGSVPSPTNGAAGATGTGSASSSGTTSSNSTGAAHKASFDGLGMLAAGATFVGVALKLLA